MANASKDKADGTKKERRPARSLEERIAELQAKAEAKNQKAREKAAANLQKLQDRIVKLESQLAEVYIARDAALAVLGDDSADQA